MNTVIEKMRRFVHGETFRYLVFGVLTVVVNIVTYRLAAVILRPLIANTLAFFVSVLFAYWTNSTFVFRVPYTRKNFIQFVAMRIGTLPIDDGGLWILLRLGVDDLLAKCIVSAVIIILNYLASKLVIFQHKEGERLKRC